MAAPGYYTINSTVVALPCGVNCITCINNTFCILCVNNSPITSGVCFSCPSTEYEVNGTCVPCNTSLSNCLTCSSSTACLSCISTSYSVNAYTRCAETDSSNLEKNAMMATQTVTTGAVTVRYKLTGPALTLLLQSALILEC